MYILHGVGDISLPFLTSAPDGQTVVYDRIEVEEQGWLPSEMVHCPSLLHSSVDR